MSFWLTFFTAVRLGDPAVLEGRRDLVDLPGPALQALQGGRPLRVAWAQASA